MVIGRVYKKSAVCFLKSQRGGLSGIIFEILLSVVALSLLIMVIYLFRGNMDIIGNSADKSNELAKVTEESLIPLGKDIVEGKDVISVVRYYADEDAVEVSVVMGPGQSIDYRDTGHGFDISEYAAYGYSSVGDFRDESFDAVYEYEGNKLLKITYTKR